MDLQDVLTAAVGMKIRIFYKILICPENEVNFFVLIKCADDVWVRLNMA